MGAVLCAGDLCRHADPELAAGAGGHRHRACDGGAHRVFPEPYPPVEPESAQAELPHHRVLQRGHHRGQDHQDPGHRGADRPHLPGPDPGDARRRHRRGPAQRHLYPAGAVCQHHGRGHRAAAGRVYGVRGTAGAGHSIHLHHLCRGHFRAHPDDRRQHRGVYLPPGVYRAGHGPDG